MKGSSEIVLKTHLDHLDPSKRERLLGYLSAEERKKIDSFPAADSEFSPVFETPKDRIHPIHYSWLLSPMEKLTNKEQELFLSAVEPIFGPTLKHALGVESSKYKATALAKNFIFSYLYKELCDGHFILPIAYLPFSNMKILLRLNKNELIHLIQKLALFDLNLELRQIVETKTLKRIYSFLTEEEKVFLKAMVREKETFAWPRMGLERWDRSQEHFKSLLHRRGIYRLAVAACSEGRDFMWHLSHRLDIGRGTLLEKSVDTKLPQRIVESTQAQILEILEG